MLRQLWKPVILLAVLTVGLSATAQAQYGYRGNIYGGIGQGVYSRGVYTNGGHGNYGYNNYARPHTSYYGNNGGGFGFNGYGRAPVWHDTTHYDYHPGGYVPHGNHIHYVPGHYDLHRSGHYHW